MLALKGSHHKGGSERASENNARAAAATTRAPRRSRRQRPRGAPQPPHAVLRGPGRATLLCCMHISWLPTYFRRDDTKGLLSLHSLYSCMYNTCTCKVRCARRGSAPRRHKGRLYCFLYVWRVQSLCCAPTAGIIRLIAAGAPPV